MLPGRRSTGKRGYMALGSLTGSPTKFPPAAATVALLPPRTRANPPRQGSAVFSSAAVAACGTRPVRVRAAAVVLTVGTGTRSGAALPARCGRRGPSASGRRPRRATFRTSSGEPAGWTAMRRPTMPRTRPYQTARSATSTRSPGRTRERSSSGCRGRSSGATTRPSSESCASTRTSSGSSLVPTATRSPACGPSGGSRSGHMCIGGCSTIIPIVAARPDDDTPRTSGAVEEERTRRRGDDVRDEK